MKNLKKVLALVLAFACAFTMFASAAFTDQAQINSIHTEAVDTLSALGVIKGYSDGSFQPQATITRAEMAKMIYVLRTGNDDASAYKNLSTSFTDIEGSWAAGYIKFCQTMGIVNGKGGNRFDPNSPVTGVEAAKMLLVTLGYKTDVGMTGSGWQQKTLALADENGLLVDVLSSITGACPREDAAQMMYNAVNAPTVRLRDGVYSHINELGGENPTIGEVYMNLKYTVGIMYDFGQTDGKSTYYASIDLVASESTDGNNAVEDFSKIKTDYIALKDQKVKVLYKSATEVFGIYSMSEDNTVLTGILANFEEDGGKLKFDGTKYSTVDDVVKVDGDVVDDDIPDFVADSSEGIAKTYDTTAISNTGNNKINLLKVETYALVKVTYVGSDYINVSTKAGHGTYTKLEEDSAEYPSDVAKDDYLIVYSAANTASGDAVAVKAEMVEGKITTTKKSVSDDDYQVKIDDEWYETAMGDERGELELDAEVSVVVKDGYVIFTDDADAGSKDVALVIAGYKSGKDTMATLLLADGSTEEVVVDGASPVGTNFNAEEDDEDKAVLVTYSISKNKYELTKIDNEASAKAAKYDDWTQDATKVKNKRLYAGNTSLVSIANEAVVFVRSGSENDYKFKAVTGADMKNWKDTSLFTSKVATKLTNNVSYAELAFVTMAGSTMPGGSDATYAYVSSNTGSYKNDDKETIQSYDVWNGKEIVAIEVKSTEKLDAGTVISYTIDADGYADIAAKSTEGTAFIAVSGDYDGTDGDLAYAEAADVTLETIKHYDLDEDYVVFLADTSKSDGKESDFAIAAGANFADYLVEAEGTSGEYQVNACNYGKVDGKTIIVIDITGELNF